LSGLRWIDLCQCFHRFERRYLSLVISGARHGKAIYEPENTREQQNQRKGSEDFREMLSHDFILPEVRGSVPESRRHSMIVTWQTT
jgi:hypothetical protein